MNNKKKIITFISVFTSLVFILIGSITLFFVIKPYEKSGEIEESEELRYYKEYYKLELDKKANEYYILGLKEEKQKQVSLKFPDTIDNIPVTKIIGEGDSFSSFKFVSEIIISKNIKYIGTNKYDSVVYRDAFSNATGIDRFTVVEENKVFESVDGVLYTEDLKTLIKFPCTVISSDAFISYTVLPSCEFIASKAFYLNESIEQIVLPDNLIEIGNSAFSNCKSLVDIKFPESLLKIGNSAFEKCEELSSIHLKQNIEFIGKSCFKQCIKLREIKLDVNPEVIKNTSLFTGIYKLGVDTIISFVVDDENQDLIKNLKDINYLKSLGITGLSGEHVTTIIRINGNNVNFK